MDKSKSLVPIGTRVADIRCVMVGEHYLDQNYAVKRWDGFATFSGYGFEPTISPYPVLVPDNVYRMWLKDAPLPAGHTYAFGTAENSYREVEGGDLVLSVDFRAVRWESDWDPQKRILLKKIKKLVAVVTIDLSANSLVSDSRLLDAVKNGNLRTMLSNVLSEMEKDNTINVKIEETDVS